MNSITNRINNIFIKTALVAAVFGLSLLAANNAYAVDSVTLRAKNFTHSATNYSTVNDYDSAVRAEPSDVLRFRLIYSSATAATVLTITLPTDLTFSDNVTGAGVTTQTAGQTITFTFSSSAFKVITFDATVAAGGSLSASHALSLNYSTNGNPASSDSVSIKTGPIIKSITPAAGSSSAVAVVLKGHGFKQTSDISSIVLSPGNINIVQPGMSVSGPDGDGLYTITGLRVDAGTSGGTYYVILTTSGFDGVAFPLSNTLSTEANTAESAAYIVDLGNPAITAYSANQNGDISGNVKAGAVVFTTTFDEALSIVPKIAINQPGTTDISATNMSLVSGNTYTYTYTVQGANGGTYVDGSATVTISTAADTASNVMTPVDHTIVIDTTKPTVQSFQIAQGINTAGTVKAGVATITVVMSEAVTTIPKIAINQPGSTDISATDMTSSGGNTYTYDYTVHAGTETGYSDGTVAVAVSTGADSFGNVMDADSSHTFTINTVSPFVANFTVTQGTNTSGYVKAGATTISITMSETVTTTPKIAINQPGSTDISATDMTSGGGNTYTFIYTVQSPADGTYMDGTTTVTISGAATDISVGGNIMSDSAHTFVIDNTKPTISLTSVVQGVNTSGNVKTGSATISITANETLSVVPQIAIVQPGSESILATPMTLLSGNTYTYAYTVNSATGGTYIDGIATMTITVAADRAGNVMDANGDNTFTIDTTAPTPVIINLSGSAAGQTAATFSWTSTYAGSDFSAYKFYYRTATGVTSANGTEISKNTLATNSLTVDNLSAATHYYAVIYICDTAGNCSAASNEADAQTSSNPVVISAPTSGGGGGGGSSASSAPSTASSSGTITTSGGAITTTVSGGTSATVVVPASSFTANSTVNVSEATSAEKVSAPIASSAGVIIPNTVFNIQSSATFSQPITLEFVYDPALLGNINPNTLSISYFSTTENKWVSLVSSVNTTTHKVSAQTTHFTLFAITTVPTTSGSTTTNTTPTTPPSTPPSDNGQVLGSSIGAYPDGALLKAPNSPAVWYIANDQKHVIPSAAVFNTRFNWADIVYLPSSRQIDLYEQGDNVLFAVGTLVKEEGKSAVYRISAANGKQPILSADIFLGRNYGWNDVIEVGTGSLSSYPTETYISDKNNFYTGDLLTVAGGTANYYYIESAAARRIPSSDIFFSRGFKSQRVRSITAAQFKQFSFGSELGYPDGTLIKGSSSAVYILANGKKRAFTSGADLDGLLYNRKRIRKVTDSFLAQIENASPIRLVQKDIHTASSQ